VIGGGYATRDDQTCPPGAQTPGGGGGGGGDGGSGGEGLPAGSDVDGNGGADLVVTSAQAGGGSAAMVAVSTYESFWMQPAWWQDPGTGWAGITPLVGDINGDRKADYVFLADAGAEGTRAYVARSTGSGLAPPQLWWNGIGYEYDWIKPTLNWVRAGVGGGRVGTAGPGRPWRGLGVAGRCCSR
jgi:hypothetical protein